MLSRAHFVLILVTGEADYRNHVTIDELAARRWTAPRREVLVSPYHHGRELTALVLQLSQLLFDLIRWIAAFPDAGVLRVGFCCGNDRALILPESRLKGRQVCSGWRAMEGRCEQRTEKQIRTTEVASHVTDYPGNSRTRLPRVAADRG